MKSFRIDLHVHTRESSFCGRTEGRLVAQLYKKAGYDGIVITDHYNRGFFRKFPKSVPWPARVDHFLQGYRGAREEGEKIGLTVLLGIELKFIDSPREYLVYGIDESFLKKYPELYRMGIVEFRRLSKQLPPTSEILIYQAHPFRPGVTPAPLELIDGIEVYNGNPRQNSNNQLALAFARQNNLRMISGSDFHRLPDLARGGLILPGPVANSRELVRVLKENEGIRLITNEHLPFSFLRLVTGAGNLIKKLYYYIKEDF
ncbi:MAG TPA: PHP domain-containing protein [Firmicutes bacterium]|uniref:PHP domain-containing protein n=1 Tax=Capillibacterium thermochitinicola TaxID=2699427 RepID=A0A8J6I314_9FIRM|nr:PHP domain-containing protein [Capillibacterium thermochitinicola]MBA2133342.1 PHP domain-containing protein [Capillibacterium thermochitinicola]HHW12232.1 PHP domain-containing protein [Bacillota bacterium]